MSVSGNDSHTPDKLSQDSFDPSIYSMESFDPSSRNEEFDPSDNEDDNNSTYSSRDRRPGSFDVHKKCAALQEQLDRIALANEKLRGERDALCAALTEAKGIVQTLTEDLQSKEKTIKELLSKSSPTKAADTVPPADSSDLASAEITLSRLLVELQHAAEETSERRAGGAVPAELRTGEHADVLRRAVALLAHVRLGHAGNGWTGAVQGDAQDCSAAEAARTAAQAADLEERLACATGTIAGLRAEMAAVAAAAAKDRRDAQTAQRQLRRAEGDVASLEQQLRVLAGEDPPPGDQPPGNAVAGAEGDVGAAQQEGRSVGLGFTFKRDSRTGHWLVNRIKPGGFAEQAGNISTGDVIVSVDGVPVQGLSQAELGSLVMGPEGSVAALPLHKAEQGQPVHIRAVRLRAK